MENTYTYRHLSVFKWGDAIVVRFGDHPILDELAVTQIRSELDDVADRSDCRYLILNFSSVVGLSTLMLGRLLMLGRQMESKGGKLVVCETDPDVHDLFATTKLDRILDVRRSEVEALKEFD